MDCAAEALPAWCDTQQLLDAQTGIPGLKSMRIMCLLHDVGAIRRLYGVVAIAVENDDRHCVQDCPV